MHKLLSPGDWVADLAGFEDEHRVVLRLFVNTFVWGVVAVAVGLYIAG